MKFKRKLRRKNSFIVSVLCICFLVVLAAHLSGCAGPSRISSEQQNYANVRFIYTDSKARSVCVAGNFNGWSKGSDCMNKNGSTWSLEKQLAPGRYQYLFVVDGQTWRKDPGAVLTESNGLGGENSILIVD